MWRAVVPLFQFAVDCWLGLGAFALISFVGCGLCRQSTPRYERKRESLNT
jgi:hypothetical protein